MVKVWEPAQTHESRTPRRMRYHYLLVCVIVLAAGWIAFGSQPAGLSVSGQRVLGIFTLCVGLWVTAAIPLQITSLLAIILLPLLNVMPSDEAFALFGNKAVFFILAAFILSAVIVDCGLSTRLTCLTLQRFAGSAVTLRNSILLFAAFASFWMSEHAVAAMLFPIVAYIVRALGLQPLESRFGMSFFFALAWGCVIGGIATYLGGARNPLAVGILFAQTGVQIGFARWLVASLPLVVSMLVLALLVLNLGYRSEPVDLKVARDIFTREREKLGPPSRREIGVGALSLLTIVSWIFLHDLFGLATIGLLSVALMFIFRLTGWEVIEQNVNWGVILMYGGAIALGSALHTTGASEWIVHNTIGRYTLSPYLTLFLLGALSLLLTEFISNAAVVSVMMPVAIGLAETNGLSLHAITLAIALPSGLSYTLPMGTPATAIAYSSGYMTQKDFLQIGPVMALLSLLMFALTARFYWPLLGF